MWLVLFVSAQNSGESIKSKWEQVARELSGKVKVGKVFSKDLALQFGLKSFPTFMYFPKRDKSGQDGNINFQGDMKANSIVSWALSTYNEETLVEPILEPVLEPTGNYR